MESFQIKLPDKNDFKFKGKKVRQGNTLEDLRSQAAAIRAYDKYSNEKYAPRRYLKDLYPRKSIGFGDIHLGRLVSIRTPWDFGIILDDSLHYSKVKKSRREFWECIPIPSSQPIQAVKTLSRIMFVYKILTKLEENYDPLYKFEDNQLVLVDRQDPLISSLNFQNICSRGVIIPERFFDMLSEYGILEPDITEAKGGTTHFVYLIDHGFFEEIDMKFIWPLPIAFSELAPLALRCSLNGISPVGEDWDKDASDKILQLMGTKRLLNDSSSTIEFYKAVNEESKPNYIWDPIPIEINTLKQLPSEDVSKEPVCYQRKNVAEELIKENLVIKWNPFPSRPAITHQMTRAACLLLTPYCPCVEQGELFNPMSQRLLKNEETRFRIYLEQMGLAEDPFNNKMKVTHVMRIKENDLS